ncbi:hypothetical protein [Microbacterium sp. NPDC058389]|uniref:hypothetical protein n=1 Tax=Microbacterium sp. NPDC058389 TaxID=3346475 RepID=UPI00365E7946
MIRDAPVDIPPSPAAFAGGRLFISVVGAGGESALVSYDVDADRWDMWDVPDAVPRTLVADGDRVLFVSGSDERGIAADLVLDATTGEWSELPPDPLGSTFDRVITPTPEGLVLTAKELVANPGSERPALTIAALYDEESGEWSRLPDTGQIGGWRWMSTGGRLVDPQLGGADGGEVGNWGRTYPYGGTFTLPDGTWSPLMDTPEPLRDAWMSDVVGPGRFALSGGYLYDAQRMTWTEVGRPDGAPTLPEQAIWADDKLLVLGGGDFKGIDGTVGQKVWTYTPSE